MFIEPKNSFLTIQLLNPRLHTVCYIMWNFHDKIIQFYHLHALLHQFYSTLAPVDLKPLNKIIGHSIACNTLSWPSFIFDRCSRPHQISYFYIGFTHHPSLWWLHVLYCRLMFPRNNHGSQLMITWSHHWSAISLHLFGVDGCRFLWVTLINDGYLHHYQVL